MRPRSIYASSGVRSVALRLNTTVFTRYSWWNSRNARAASSTIIAAKERVRAMTDRLARENGGEATSLHFEDNGFGNAPDCLIVLPAKKAEIGDV